MARGDAMQELDITWKRVVSIWWLMAWRGVVGSVVIGAICGGTAGFILAIVLGSDANAIKPSVGRNQGAAVGCIWGFFVFSMALRKDYRGFQLVLRPLVGGGAMPGSELTWKRVASVWWLLAWRGGVGAVAIGAACGFVSAIVLAIIGLRAAYPNAGAVLGAVGGFIWGFFVVRMALRKDYRDFRLALLPLAPSDPAAHAT